MNEASLTNPPPVKALWKRVLTLPAVLVAAIIVLLEEFIWDKITNVVVMLARLRLVARLDAWIVTLGPYPTLGLFAIPLVTLLPLKILAIYLIAQGQVGLGIGVILLAKGTGTAISAHLFVIAKPKLMTFSSFVVVYNKVVQFNHWAHEVVAGWPIVPKMRRLVVVIKERLQYLRAYGRGLMGRYLGEWL